MYTFFGDFVKVDTFDFVIIFFAEFACDMPCDSLTLTVGVRSKKDLFCCLRLFLEVIQNLFLSSDCDIFGIKAVFYIYSKFVGGKIFNMPHASEDFVTFAQIFLYGFGFRRRLNNNKVFCHTPAPV